MTRFELRIKTENDAFAPVEAGEAEIARILRDIANQLEDGERYKRIFDSNGNRVGSWAWVADIEPA